MKIYQISWWGHPPDQKMRDCLPEVEERVEEGSIRGKILEMVLKIILKIFLSKVLKEAEEKAQKKKRQLGERSRVVIVLGIGEEK